MKIYKSPQFPDNRAWFQSGFADGWSKPHPYSEVLAKQQFVALLSETDKHIQKRSLPMGKAPGRSCRG